jgi:hypothetical protein
MRHLRNKGLEEGFQAKHALKPSATHLRQP